MSGTPVFNMAVLRFGVMNWRRVTEAEAKRFVMEYPKCRLDWNGTTVCDPPLGNYNDFDFGVWPESMVVKVVMNDRREDWEWFIREDLFGK